MGTECRSTANLVPIGEGIMKLRICVKINIASVFFLPVNIPTMWCAGFLGLLDVHHYTLLGLHKHKEITLEESMKAGFKTV